MYEIYIILHFTFALYLYYRFNITTSLQLVNRFLLMPGSMSAAKCAEDGELFARMKLEDDLSVDSVAGRLILKTTNLVWLAPHENGSKSQVLPKKVQSKPFGNLFNPFPYKPWFLHVCSTNLLKTLWKKGEIARNEQFLFFPQYFLPIWRVLCHFHQIFHFGRV